MPRTTRNNRTIVTETDRHVGPYSYAQDHGDPTRYWLYCGPYRIALVEFGLYYGQDVETETRTNACLLDDAWDLYEASKFSLLVLCALLEHHGAALHPNLRRDVEFAIEANRSAQAKAREEAANG